MKENGNSQKVTLTEELMKKAFKDVTPGKAHMDKIYKYWDDDISMAIYPLQEEILDRIFHDPKYISNSDHDIVKFKVTLVNSYYSTNLTDGFDKMIDNICNYENFDADVSKGEMKVIEKIRTSKAKLAKNEEKDCLSFSSKYCSRINPEKYPIYDNYVRRMLWALNRKYHFHKTFTLTDLCKDYALYKNIIDAFINEFFTKKGESLTYKEFDKYIWTWAKKILNEKKEMVQSL